VERDDDTAWGAAMKNKLGKVRGNNRVPSTKLPGATKSLLEVVPISPGVQAKIRQILKDRGFSQYQK
jgi:hypothetical protein